ncbi:MAG: GH92 family glycosyl hydrolase [Pyrinomonadaceae bacterium]
MPRRRVWLKPDFFSSAYLRLKSEAIHKNTFLSALLLIALCSLPGFAQTRDYTRHVNPFIGTGGHGHTFPGATVPFGMVQLSPDTRIDNWDGSSGYHYSDEIIYGFSHTHLSGTGIPDGCDILFMPTTKDLNMAAQSGNGNSLFAENFSHADEKAEPGYYSVRMEDEIFVELSSTLRVGIHRYTFPSKERAIVAIDLKWRDKLLGSGFNRVSPTRIEGYRQSASWAKNQTVYFAAEFSRPYELKFESKSNENVTQSQLDFDLKDDRQLLVKIAISYVSIEGARKNLEAELPGWDFDKVRADAKAAWNKELSKIEASGGTPEQTTNFYTALYHTMIHPNVFNDVDGRYKGHDGKIHQLRNADTPVRNEGRSGNADTPVRNEGRSGNADTPVRNEGRFGPKEPRTTQMPRKRKSPSPEEPAIADKSVRVPSEQYTVFSLWDTFRGAHPLYTIIDEKRTVDFINTFIHIYEQGGRLPVWELWGEETDTMIGYHVVSVIADAMAKGIKGFDYEKAYAAAKHSAELDHFGLAGYKKRGYISSEDENESVSKTLEYAYNDWCIARMGRILFWSRYHRHQIDAGESKLGSEIRYYERRARYFENLFDPETGFMRPKRNGNFMTPFAPNEVTFNFTEGNSWVYSFFVPQDITRLIELYGGPEKFEAKLDELFTTQDKLTGRFQPDITGLIGQYAHGNEPSHHIAYLYDYVGKPSKTQKLVRRILDEFYKNDPDGLIGNEDCGQMSAWYILSASGFYPVTPGQPRYAFGTPIFKEVKYNLENGKTFIVKAPNVSARNIYINGAKLNGKPHTSAYIDHDDIMRGGTLELEMTDKPNDKAFAHWPSSGMHFRYTSVPLIVGDHLFRDETRVSITSARPSDKFFYTLDGTEPTARSLAYQGTFTLEKTTTVRAIAIDKDGGTSKSTEAIFRKRPNDWKVVNNSGYSSQYTGDGDDGIIDSIRGNVNFSSGEWQGYQGKTFEAVIDLQRPTEIKEVGGGFLQSAGAWIWMPDRIEFEVSTDGTNFTKIAEIKPAFPQTEMKAATRDFVQRVMPVTARYVRIRAYNFGKIPSWHLGAGGDPWIFVDEVIIR